MSGAKLLCPKCKTTGEVIIGNFLNCACGKEVNTVALPEALPEVSSAYKPTDYYLITVGSTALLPAGTVVTLFSHQSEAITYAKRMYSTWCIFVIPIAEVTNRLPMVAVGKPIVCSGILLVDLDSRKRQPVVSKHSVGYRYAAPLVATPTTTPAVLTAQTPPYYYLITTQRDLLLRQNTPVTLYVNHAVAITAAKTQPPATWYIFKLSTAWLNITHHNPLSGNASGLMQAETDLARKAVDLTCVTKTRPNLQPAPIIPASIYP